MTIIAALGVVAASFVGIGLSVIWLTAMLFGEPKPIFSL